MLLVRAAAVAAGTIFVLFAAAGLVVFLFWFARAFS